MLSRNFGAWFTISPSVTIYLVFLHEDTREERSLADSRYIFTAAAATECQSLAERVSCVCLPAIRLFIISVKCCILLIMDHHHHHHPIPKHLLGHYSCSGGNSIFICGIHLYRFSVPNKQAWPRIPNQFVSQSIDFSPLRYPLYFVCHMMRGTTVRLDNICLVSRHPRITLQCVTVLLLLLLFIRG